MQSTNNETPLHEEEMELQLWAYIDDVLPPKERQAVEELLVAHGAWREKYQSLLAMHQSLNEIELEEPSLRFTRNVMEEIGRMQIAPAAKQYINNKVIWGIAAFFVTVIAGFLVYALAQVDWAAGSNNEGLLGKVANADYSKVFSNGFVNGFMAVNVILGLMLFDRYLDNKKRGIMSEV